MKVSLNSTLQAHKQRNYRPNFTSCEIQKDDYGERVYAWSFPYDSTKYDCYLETFPVIPDKNGNYENNSFRRKYVDMRTGFDYVKLEPDGTVFDLDYIFGRAKDAPFAYRYRLQQTPKEGKSVDTTPIYMFDAGDLVDKRNFSNDWESVYNIFVPTSNTSRKAGAAILIGADNFDVRYMYNEKGEIVPNPDAEKGFNTYKNFSNHIGGTLAGVHQALRDGRLDLYDKIFYLPHTSGDVTTPHGYWLESAYLLSSAGGGNIDNFIRFNNELFAKGKTLVTDSALTSEGVNGIHIESIFEHGTDDVFFDWFKAGALKNMTAKIGVFGKNTRYIRHKLINGPEYPVQDSNGNISWKTNKTYRKNEPVEVQVFNIDQTTPEQVSNPQLAIDKYGNPSGSEPLAYGTHNDTIIPYKKRINFETYKANVDRLSELNKTLRKQKKPIIPLESYMGTRIALKFEGFEFEDKIDGGINNWDANFDMYKFDYAESNEDVEDAMNLPLDERQKFFIKKAQKRAEVLDYAVSSLKYWATKTNQELNLYVAQNLRGMDVNNAQNAQEFIQNKIRNHKLPEKIYDTVNVKVIENVLNNKYKLNGAKSVDNFRDTILGGLMDYPLESTEAGKDILALFSTPYITNRATQKEQIGKSRLYLLKHKDPHLTKQYENVYNLTTRMYTDSMYTFAREIIDEVNDSLDKNNKLNRDGDTSKYGKYVLPIITQEIAKFAVVKGLFPDITYSINPDRGGITYDYDSLKRKSLRSLGIRPTSQENEAEDLVLALKSGIKKISKKDKANLVKAINKMIEGTNLKSFEMAEMIVDRTKSGMELRVDAAKDFSNMDALRNGIDRFDDNWDEVIRILSAIGKGVHEVNENGYIVPEITNEVDLYKLGEGNMSDRFDWHKSIEQIPNSDQYRLNYNNDLIRKLIREGNVDAVANYQSYFSNIESIFGKRGDDGADWGAEQYDRMYKIFARAPRAFGENDKGFYDNVEEFLYSGQLDSIIKSYTFVENHDKPRINHLLSLDMGLFFADLNFKEKPHEKEYRRRAFEVLNPGKNSSLEEVNRFDFSNVSAMAVARGESKNLAFDVSVKAIANVKDLNTNKEFIPENEIKQVINDLKVVVAELASGKCGNLRFEPDNFGTEEIHKLIGLVLARYANTTGRHLSPEALQALYDATFEEMLKRPLKNSLGMTKFLVAAPGIPTVYAGYSNTGFERKTKNSFQKNRSADRPDFEDKYQFIRDEKENRDNVLLLRSRPALHALNDGGVFLLKRQQTNQGKVVTGLLRYAPDGNAVITLFNVSGTTHDYRGINNPLMNGVDLANNRIDLAYEGNEGYVGLHGGLPVADASKALSGMKFVNAYDENDVYEVFNSDGMDGYYLAKEKECKTPICLQDNILVLYHASDVLKQKDKAFMEKVRKAKESKTSFCGRKTYENKIYNVSPVNYKKAEEVTTGSKLALVSSMSD